jgi:hypothetical protein
MPDSGLGKTPAGAFGPLETPSPLIYIYTALYLYGYKNNNSPRSGLRPREVTMSTPTKMNTPKKRSDTGIPVGLLIIILGVILVISLVSLGVWSLSGYVKLSTIPVAGEWQAKGKPWHIELRPDKTAVSSTGPAQPGATQAWTSEPGAYRVDYFGNLWVTLKNGKTYTAALAPPPGALAPPTPDRFDLIESGTEAVTVFERTLPAKPTPPGS